MSDPARAGNGLVSEPPSMTTVRTSSARNLAARCAATDDRGMARSSCPKSTCNGTRFELVQTDKVEDCQVKLNFIQCSACGAVVGVLPFWDAAEFVQKLANALGKTI